MWIFDFLIDVLGYTVARLVLPFASFGRLYVEPLSSPLKRFNSLGYRRDEGGRIEIEETVAGFIGFITFLVAFFIGGGLLTRLAI
jgi:hypothetical protein